MNLPFRVIRTRPTYLEFDNEAFGYDPLYRKLLDFMPPLSVQIKNHFAESTHQQFSLQRRHACKPIDLHKTGTTNLLLLSHLIVTDSHPIEIFYQNVLCDLYGTTVLFPLRHPSFHRKLASQRIGDFNVFVEKMFLADDSCPVIADDEVRVVSLEIDDDDDYEDSEAVEIHGGSWIHHMLENPTKSIDELIENPESHDAYYRKEARLSSNSAKSNRKTASVTTGKSGEEDIPSDEPVSSLEFTPNILFSNPTVPSSFVQQDGNSIPDPASVAQELKLSQKNWRQEITAQAQLHQVQNSVILLLATHDYFDILHNFFCYVGRIFEGSTNLPFLILTNDASIRELATHFHAGVVSSSPESLRMLYQSYPDCDHAYNCRQSIAGADFGTVLYQSLMFSRSQTALSFLQAGFNVIIADIDTVWQQNPLLWPEVQLVLYGDVSTGAKEFDIAIVQDGDEFCGCFIVLRGDSINAQLLWSNITAEHETIVVRAISRHKDSDVDDTYDESEQKILTHLLKDENGYRGQLRARLLSSEAFPDGLHYFHDWNVQDDKHSRLPVIIHNNFILGKYAKYNRFERYNLWQYRPPVRLLEDNGNDESVITASAVIGIQHCYSRFAFEASSDSDRSSWTSYFSNMTKPSFIPTVEMMLPTHNFVSITGKFRSMVLLEGITATKERLSVPVFGLSLNQANSLVQIGAFQLSTIQIPVNSSAIRSLVVRSFPHLSTGQAKSFPAVAQLMQDFQSPVIAPNYLVTQNNSFDSFWSLDFGQNHSIVALAQNRARNADIGEASDFAWGDDNLAGTSRENVLASGGTEQQRELHRSIRADAEKLEHNALQYQTSQCLEMNYRITVLTMNRLQSLKRLLTSLRNAKYDPVSNITLDIHVDLGRNLQENKDRERIIDYLHKEFHWPYGLFLITDMSFSLNGPGNASTLNQNNIGLKRQWQLSWSPVNMQEVNFVFEDDLEVSPLYFHWASRAVQKYYACNKRQRNHHSRLLQSLLSTTATSSLSTREFRLWINTSLISELAGHPLLYGICLQRQDLAPNHHHVSLSTAQEHIIQTGFRPFLYSLIGSWGPLFFPGMFQAFRLWWSMYEIVFGDQTPPLTTETLQTNDYLRRNPRIWTPYIIRFAFETGAKCLYPSRFVQQAQLACPDQPQLETHKSSEGLTAVALVINHREQGENYVQSMGPDASLLVSTPSCISSNEMIEPQNLNEHWYARESLWNGFCYLPSEQELAHWQYDFNLRRSGSVSLVDATVVRRQGHSMSEQSYVDLSSFLLSAAYQWYAQGFQDPNQQYLQQIEERIFAEVWEMLQRHFLAAYHYQHVLFVEEVTPLLPLMVQYVHQDSIDNEKEVEENSRALPLISIVETEKMKCNQIGVYPSNDTSNIETTLIKKRVSQMVDNGQLRCLAPSMFGDNGKFIPVNTVILTLSTLTSSRHTKKRGDSADDRKDMSSHLFHYMMEHQKAATGIMPRYVLVMDIHCHSAPATLSFQQTRYVQVERSCDTVHVGQVEKIQNASRRSNVDGNGTSISDVKHFREFGGILYRLQFSSNSLPTQHLSQVIQRLTPTLTRSQFVGIS
jgi:hypothetical protein